MNICIGVVCAEMPASYEMEALKAQAVVARTYTIYTITHNSEKHGDGSICTSSACCQAWLSKDERMSKWSDEEKEGNWAKIEEAVNSTKGKVIEYNGEAIDAFFHSNSGLWRCQSTPAREYGRVVSVFIQLGISGGAGSA